MEFSSFQPLERYDDLIISDDYKFAFIHIPKCGGTDIKFDLGSLDSYSGAFDGVVKEHNGRTIDFTHLPLNVIKKEFPDVFAKIMEYDTFAIVRDPASRFKSALNQYVKSKYELGFHEFSNAQLSLVAKDVIDSLTASGDNLDPLFIHFQPQSDFILCDNIFLVKNLYPIESVDALQHDMKKKYGVDFSARKFGRKFNVTLEYRSLVGRLVASMVPKILRAMLRSTLPQTVLEYLRVLFLRPSKSVIQELDSETVKFIGEYYKRDYEIYRDIVNEWQ